MQSLTPCHNYFFFSEIISYDYLPFSLSETFMNIMWICVYYKLIYNSFKIEKITDVQCATTYPLRLKNFVEKKKIYRLET